MLDTLLLILFILSIFWTFSWSSKVLNGHNTHMTVKVTKLVN